ALGTDDLEKTDVDPLRKCRVHGQLRPQYTDVCALDRIDANHRMRIAERYRAELDLAARKPQPVSVLLRRSVEGQRLGLETRHAEIHAHDPAVAHQRLDRARAAFEPEPVRAAPRAARRDEVRDAARAVAALLDFSAVRVVNPIARIALAGLARQNE